MIDQELAKIIQENKEVLQSLDQRLHKIERNFTWNTVFGFIKAIVIIGPIIVGIIYLTPIVKDYFKIFEPIIKTIQSGTNNFVGGAKLDNTTANSVINSLCDPQARDALVKELCK